MSDHLHVVLDDTAMVAAGRGNIAASRLIYRAHHESTAYLYAPACALVEADRKRPGTAEHLASLPALIVLDLDLPAALTVAREGTWAEAHARYAAAPNAERPEGAFIATAAPERWVEWPVRVIDVNP
ncbi:hypothetical protein ACFP1Z_16715 [Streptomyces gamaensis]|uniref:Uncharacterized protein n=1 Tax=Streptomyces gamaensis TaxID=1763542 RepID=A0ABW0Z375_9ACTN